MQRGKTLAREKTFFPVICRKNNIPEYEKLQLLPKCNEQLFLCMPHILLPG